MSKKSKKVEKETRRLMEGIADLVKKKGDRYKFKTKSKKAIKKVSKTCPHWIMRKGKEAPVVEVDPQDPTMWRCRICGERFPIRPMTREEYEKKCTEFLQAVNQMQFWSVKLGGDAEDTKMFLQLKAAVPRFKKVSRQILKNVNKRQAWDDNRKNTDVMSQFDSYTGFNYKM
jgi:hypothetical protein